MNSCYSGNSRVYSLIRVLFLMKGQHPLASDSSFYTLTLLTHIDDFSMSAFPHSAGGKSDFHPSEDTPRVSHILEVGNCAPFLRTR